MAAMGLGNVDLPRRVNKFAGIDIRAPALSGATRRRRCAPAALRAADAKSRRLRSTYLGVRDPATSQ